MNHIKGYLLIAPLLITLVYMIGWAIVKLCGEKGGFIVLLKGVALIVMYVAFLEGLSILSK